MRILERLFLTLLILLPNFVFAHEIVGVKVEPTQTVLGQPVNITVDIDHGGRNKFGCGLLISFGDGNTNEISLGENDAPQVIAHSYTGTGSYNISVEGKAIFRGLNTKLPCKGSARSTVTISQRTNAPAPSAGRAYTSTARETAATPRSPIDPVGVWQHSPEATWTISVTPDGRYFAQEQGLGNASGPAYWTPSETLRIDYTTRDGAVKGYYEVRFSPDGKTASGSVRELTGPMRSGSTNWVKQQAQITPPPNTGRAYTSIDRTLGQRSQITAGGLPVTLYWHMADDADVYLNGVPLRRYEPSFKTRGDEAPMSAFTTTAELRNGDVFTVGGRRGGSFGFMLIAIDSSGRVVFTTDQSWQVYEPPGDRPDWYQPAVANASPKTPVTVQPNPWYPQKELNKKYGDPALSVWGSPSSTFSFLTKIVSGIPGGGTASTHTADCVREAMLYTNGNVAGVYNYPTQPTRFKLAAASLISSIVTYHWNDGQGQPPGSVGLQHQDGTRYGPWQVITAPGQGGVPNAYWIAHPQVVLKPGTYTVWDSHPASWAQNLQSGGQGIVEIKGCDSTANVAAIPNTGRAYTATGRAYTSTARDTATPLSQGGVTSLTPPRRVYSKYGSYSYVVPAGVTSLHVKMWGAGGFSSMAYSGGGGGYVGGIIATTPGETLSLQVARAPFYLAGGNNPGDYLTGGYGGGGNGGGGPNFSGGGGGASRILRGATILMVAGGGGGGGNGAGAGAGGAGGGTSGADGGNGSQGHTFGGGGGTQSTGGAGGAGNAPTGGNGSFGQGGNAVTSGTNEGAGGGGGGYYGGGAGGGDSGTSYGGGGGGGGSSYTHPTAVTTAVNMAGSGATPGNSNDTDRGSAGNGGFYSPMTNPGDGKIVLY